MRGKWCICFEMTAQGSVITYKSHLSHILSSGILSKIVFAWSGFWPYEGSSQPSCCYLQWAHIFYISWYTVRIYLTTTVMRGVYWGQSCDSNPTKSKIYMETNDHVIHLSFWHLGKSNLMGIANMECDKCFCNIQIT